MKEETKEKPTAQDIPVTDAAAETAADTKPGEAPQADAAEAPTPEAQLEAAQAEITRLKDQNLRQVAEFDNYRKRTLREKADLILNGGEKVIGALLPVLDDLERARQNLDKSADYDTLKQGVELIAKKLRDILERQGLKPIDAAGKDFDTDYHEAIAMVPVEDASKKGKVIDCVATGYMLNDKVLRHAKVAVGQ